MSYLIEMSIAFGLYRNWAFPSSRAGIKLQSINFILVNIAGFVIVLTSTLVISRFIMIRFMLISANAEAGSHVIAIILGAIANYAGHRLVTFAQDRPITSS